MTYTAVLSKNNSHIFQLVKQAITVAASAIANSIGSAITSSGCETLKPGRVWQSLDCSVLRSDCTGINDVNKWCPTPVSADPHILAAPEVVAHNHACLNT